MTGTDPVPDWWTIFEPVAAKIRDAAGQMRAQHGPGHVRHAFWHELARWLDSAAYRRLDADSDIEPDDWNAAMDIARAYTAAEKEPDA